MVKVDANFSSLSAMESVCCQGPRHFLGFIMLHVNIIFMLLDQ